MNMHGNLALMETIIPPPVVSAVGSWCALAVWAGQEWHVQREITQFPTYLPLETLNVVIRGRRLKKVRPLISGYLFVQLDRDESDWGSLEKQRLRGSIGLLKNELLPATIPDQVIERIRTAEAAGVFDYTGYSPFAPGESVEITEGPFAGLIAKIKSASPRKRARLFMGALGEVQIDPAFLKKLGA